MYGENTVNYNSADYSGVNSAQKTGRVYFGARAGLRFRFYTQEEHNLLKSEQLGYEYREPVEFCEFTIDSKNKYCPKIDVHLFNKHPEILQDYQAWKKGVESGVTLIKDWDIITPGEKGQLFMAGFDTVESIEQASEEKLYAIGTNWKDVKRKADHHIAAKSKEDLTEQAIKAKQELTAVLEAKDEQIQKLSEMVAQLMNKVEAKAEVKPAAVKKTNAKG